MTYAEHVHDHLILICSTKAYNLRGTLPDDCVINIHVANNLGYCHKSSVVVQRCSPASHLLLIFCVRSFSHFSFLTISGKKFSVMYQCQNCDREFQQATSCRQHMSALDHWAPAHECDICEKKFPSGKAAEQHMDALGHWEHYCDSCQQQFQNANNLRMVIPTRYSLHEDNLADLLFSSTNFRASTRV